MKNRSIAAVIIVFAIALVTIWSSYLLTELDQNLSMKLEATANAASCEEWEKAEQYAQQATQLLRKNQTLLSYFVAHSQLSELDETISVLPVYARCHAEEITPEIEKARSQLRALSLLFFRTL